MPQRAALPGVGSRFTEITGVTPSRYRELDHRDLEVVPPCVAKLRLRRRRNHRATG